VTEIVEGEHTGTRAGAAGPRTPGRVPPNNLDAERSLLGAMLLSREAIGPAVETLRAADFYKPSHQHIFDAIAGSYASGETADAITVAETLSRADLLEHVWDFAYDGSSNVVDAYVSRVRDAVDRPFDEPLIETVRGVGYRLRG